MISLEPVSSIPDTYFENVTKFQERFQINNLQFLNVYEIFVSVPEEINKYIRILIHRDEGLIYFDDQILNHKTFIRAS